MRIFRVARAYPKYGCRRHRVTLVIYGAARAQMPRYHVLAAKQESLFLGLDAKHSGCVTWRHDVAGCVCKHIRNNRPAIPHGFNGVPLNPDIW